MKQILVQLDDRLATQLEKIAPGRSRKRSEFLRRVIARAVQEVLEVGTRKAYAEWPAAPPLFDPEEWAPETDAVRPLARRRLAPGRRRSHRKTNR